MPDRSASANLVESVVVNMIKFAICDDEPRMSQDLAARLAGYMEERQITAYLVSRVQVETPCWSGPAALT